MYIKMFNIKFQHVLGWKYTAANGLLRKILSFLDKQDINNEIEINKYFNLQINILALKVPVNYNYPL
jgi:hypothetical protein